VPEGFIVGIPATALMQTSNKLWSVSLSGPKSLMASGITMGILHGDQSCNDLLGNIRYLDILGRIPEQFGQITSMGYNTDALYFC